LLAIDQVHERCKTINCTFNTKKSYKSPASPSKKHSFCSTT
jgi:hypothetical protein